MSAALAIAYETPHCGFMANVIVPPCTATRIKMSAASRDGLHRQTDCRSRGRLTSRYPVSPGHSIWRRGPRPRHQPLKVSINDVAVPSNSRSYDYDALGRLTSATGPFGANGAQASASYVYDALGNLRVKTEGSRTVTLNYNALNRLSSSVDSGATGTRSLSYDSRGNVTRLGSLYMGYDISDQPVSISGTANGTGSANGNYWYDGNLKRVKSVVNGQTNYNVYDISGKLVHVQTGTDETDYIDGPLGPLARVKNDVVTWIHPDHLGSAQAGTSAGTSSNPGGIVWREQYTPFGAEVQGVAANDNQAGFTGHIKDKATGLSYMQARYYDPVIGRFLSIDPVGFMDTQDPGYFNRYAYSLNDPVNRFDPDGRQSVIFSEADRKLLKQSAKNKKCEPTTKRSAFRFSTKLPRYARCKHNRCRQVFSL